MWLFVLCQEHNTVISYQCWLHWHPFKPFCNLRQTIYGSDIILGFLPTISRLRKILLSTDSYVNCQITTKLVLAAFNLAAPTNDHENEEHQNLNFSGICQSPVASK
jgi:hypothetical protein